MRHDTIPKIINDISSLAITYRSLVSIGSLPNLFIYRGGALESKRLDLLDVPFEPSENEKERKGGKIKEKEGRVWS